ncbi:polysaccharide biosynthesis protein [Treponema brennaborense DSM 12168]|uniref:Polysaccharide biosynthesis protein n=2 Tax=Treponema TaxID=157 RepID=F4LNN6_TREBD|nr:polysaccharide biosynthesis protein [Treponema brennaborense DSM 12168]
MYQTPARRIAKNTLMLYFRQILIMLVSLYTVREVLNVLGAEDYGIYNVVAGVVTMFGFLSGAMATASQRYFSFEMGRGDISETEKTAALIKIFGVTLTIYALIVLIIVFLAETAGLWFVCNKLIIPAERLTAAKWIYQFAVLSFVITMMTTPYMAAIIAHENMNVYAYVSIAEAVLKLIVVFILQALPYDKLIVYGVLLFVVTFITTLLYRIYCRYHYRECGATDTCSSASCTRRTKIRNKTFHTGFMWDRQLYTEMIRFIGWNFFGSFAWIIKSQGISILLNTQFGPIVNASRGIALQVRQATQVFSQNFSTAVKPQITKLYASFDYPIFFSFLFRSCKMTFFLMLIVVIPLYMNMNQVLALWLGVVPEYVVPFSKLLLLESLAESISLPLMTANQATGRIKTYQLTLSIISFFNLPISFAALKMGFAPQSVFAIGAILEILISFARMVFLICIQKGSFTLCLKKLTLPCVAVTAICFTAGIFFPFHAEDIKSLIVFAVLEMVFVAFTVFIVGLDTYEKKLFIESIKNKCMKKH